MTCLFLFAHQDDEFGCFFEIHRLVNSGTEVIVAYLTSGSPDGNRSSVRNAESISVLEKIGVHEDNIYFLGTDVKIPDGLLCNHLEVAFKAVANLIGKIGVPKNMYLHAWEGGHQDHDAAHLVGIVLAEHLGITESCYQFPLYTGASLRSIFFKLFAYLPENGQPKLMRIPWRLRVRFLRLCFCYSSQKKTWAVLFPFLLTEYLFRGSQILQRVSVERILQAPHVGTLLYERRGFYNYQKFLLNTDGFVNRHLQQSRRIISGHHE
jgi:LmbE family N-acetylglucosaminyl deacetylase